MRYILPICAVLLSLGVSPAEALAHNNVGCSCPGVVFVADGAGGIRDTSTNLQTVLSDARLHYHVQRVAWSYGRLCHFVDLIHHTNHRRHGCELAAQVQALLAASPQAQVYLVGHSSGAAVVLAAAECLPPGSVARIILLAPAVSSSYDLSAALRCSRDGIDSFYSKTDQVLSTLVVFLGTADRQWEAAAGWDGFKCIPCGMSGLLRQYEWQGLGGHYGCTSVSHLRDHVLPLIATSCQTCVTHSLPVQEVQFRGAAPEVPMAADTPISLPFTPKEPGPQLIEQSKAETLVPSLTPPGRTSPMPNSSATNRAPCEVRGFGKE